MVKLCYDLIALARHWLRYEAIRAKQTAVEGAVSVAMILLALVLLVGAAGLLIASAFIAIASHLGPALAALLTGGGLLMLALILVVLARTKSR